MMAKPSGKGGSFPHFSHPKSPDLGGFGLAAAADGGEVSPRAWAGEGKSGRETWVGQVH
jgi:hypothetical protein